jgi:tetratricopeptide (TPR) repeat protein
MEANVSELKEQCSRMTDEELIETLALERGSYTDDFCQIAFQELKQRKYEFNSAQISLNNKDETTLPNAQALEKVSEDISYLDTWFCTNSLTETLLILKGFSYWEMHHVFSMKCRKTFFIESFSKVKEILEKFLNLEIWDEEIEQEYHIDEWTMFITTSSYDYTRKEAERLSHLGILYAVETEALANYVDFYTPFSKASFTLFIPYEYHEVAEGILEEDKVRIDALYERLSETKEPEKELEIYNELIELDPDDAMAFHNRGVLLYERENYKEATESFIQSASLIMTFHESEDIAEEADEILGESENALQNVIEKDSENLDALHTLASISWYRGELSHAKEFYEKILSIKPDDEIAKENISNLEKLTE